LASGYLTQASWLNYLAYLPETQDDINTAYENILGRPIDSTTLASWEAGLASGGTTLTIIWSDIATSPEAQADINAIFERILGRASTSAGIATTEANLASGSQTMAAFESSVADSTEVVTDISATFQSVTGSAIDQATLASGEAALASGGYVAGVGGIILDSSDMQTLYALDYEQMLGRDPTSAEISAETSDILSRLPNTVALSFGNIISTIDQSFLTFLSEVNPIGSAIAAEHYTTAQQAANVTAAQAALADPRVSALKQITQQAEGGQYDNVYGGKTVSDLSHYPTGTNAAGAFQVAPGTYHDEQLRLGVNDFYQPTQDLIWADLAIQKGAVAAIQAGDLPTAINDLAQVWAAIPLGSGSDDHSKYQFSSGAHKGAYQPSMPYDSVVSLYHTLSGH
jgi:muramidase (phage lysozyme)